MVMLPLQPEDWPSRQYGSGHRSLRTAVEESAKAREPHAPQDIQGSHRQEAGSAQTLTLEDAEALNGLPSVVAVAPEVDSFGQLVYQSQNSRTRVIGRDAGIPDGV
jgi:hypothetical protein